MKSSYAVTSEWFSGTSLFSRRWRNIRRAVCDLLVAALTLTFVLTETSQAGDAGLAPPPLANVVDRWGINLTTGFLMTNGPSISIGAPGQGGLTYQSSWGGPMYTPNGWARTEEWESTVKYQTSIDRTVTVLGKSEQFSSAGGGTWAPTNSTGGTLVQSGSNYTYTDREGTVTQFMGVSLSCGYWCTAALASTMTRPNGETWSFTWRTKTWMFVLMSVTTNRGYQLKVNLNCSNSSLDCYVEVDNIMLINNAVEYCDPTATSCSPSNSWPTLTFSGTNNTTVTDSLSHSWTLAGSVTSSGGYYHVTTTVTQPTGQYFSWLYDIDQWTSEWSNRRVTDGTNTWYYSITDNLDGTITGWSSDPNSVVREILTDQATGQPNTDTLNPGGINLQSYYLYYGGGLLYSATLPNGDGATMSYDGNGNIDGRYTWGAGQPYDVSATFGITCNGSNYKNCNKPTITYDANGNDTLYTYSATHGGLETVQGPSVNGVRSRTDYNYTAYYAWYKNSGGSIVQAGVPVYLVSSATTCTTANTCSSSANERVTVNTYQSGSGSVASNLLQTQITVRAGDNSISSTGQTSYDMYGNIDTTTGPNSGVTQYFYDGGQRRVGVVQPDPDGGGGNPYPATKITYDNSNRVLQAEQGTVPSQSRYDFDNSFTSLIQAASAYDSVTGSKIRDTASIGGTAQSVTQYAYDAGGRPTCTAKRQNAAVFGALPSDACTQSSTGSYGVDQIARNYYDAANRLDYVQSGVGSGTPITVVKNGYSSTYPGQLEWVEDGKQNRSQYAYGYNNQITRIYFPDPSSINTYNPSDYEEYTYDDQANMLTKRLRSNSTITMSYDEMNRLELKDMPSGDDTYYTYNQASELLSARYNNASTGYGTIFTWDALGRKLTESSYTAGYTRTITSQYDASGNRTRLTYPDSNYIEYTYDTLSRMYQVKENGSTVLATYGYDGLGRVNAISRSNSTTTSASYGGSSQNWSLSQDLASTGQDVTFSMDYSPAAQVVTRGINNGSYRYGVGSSSTTNYCSNGLNQYAIVGGASGTCSGGTSLSYDARGNLTSDGSRSFTYDLENKLTDVGSSCTPMCLAYDPLGRLLETNASSTVQDYLYDGDARVAEMDSSGNIQRRYVPGQGTDETLVWYEGSNLSTPAWLHTDQQGSTVAASNNSGVSATTYTYGSFGEGGISGGAPNFRYTGQAQLVAAGLYYYKARMYDPNLGRFLQTDPIGYSAGMNLYAYVMDDPANLVDPTGLDPECRSGDDVETVCSTATRLYRCIENGRAIYSEAPCQYEPATLSLLPEVSVPYWNPGHEYKTDNQVCRRPMTDREQRTLLRRFALPGFLLASSSTGIVVYGPVPGGVVNTEFSNSGRTVTNSTTPFHWFVGKITRTVSPQSISTYGEGHAGMTAWGTVRDAVNGAMGPRIFSDLDARAAEYAAANFKGC